MADFFSTLFGGGAEQEAADKNRAALAQYQPQALDYLKTGYTTGQGDINQAIGAYQPLATMGTQYGAAAPMLTNALGLGGAAGNAAATNAFQVGPGYQFALNQGLDALNRRRAIGGQFSSGNADIDAMTYGQGLGNQEYQNWLKNLQTTGQMGISATGAAAQGQGQGYTNLANLAQTYAGNQAGVSGNVLSGTMDANKLQAAGEAAGAKNLLGAGLSLATLGAGGSGGLGTALFGGNVPANQTYQPGLFQRMFGSTG